MCCVIFSCHPCGVASWKLHYIKLIFSQVLTEVTVGRKRRKQARPAKAAGDVVPAVPHAVPQPFNLSLPSFHNNSSPACHKSPSPAPQFPVASSPHSVLSNGSRPPSTASLVASAQNSVVDGHSSKASSVSPAPRLSPAQLAAASFPANTLPFNYTAFYQNNISNLFAPQAANSKAAALFAQTLYVANAASTNSLLNNSLLMGKNMLPNVSTPYQNSSNSKVQAKSNNGHVTAKKEPKVPTFNFTSSAVSGRLCIISRAAN